MNELRQTLNRSDLMPWNDPHTAAPSLWAWQDAEGVRARAICCCTEQSKTYCTGQYDIITKDCIREVSMNNFRFSVVIEKDDDGYTAFCPELQGCYAQGETYEEVLDNIRDAIRLHLDDRIESGEKIPQAQLINLTTVDVSV
jgi:predicted RNase H-like HicB family nuclease